jgi:hypothetical protein
MYINCYLYLPIVILFTIIFFYGIITLAYDIALIISFFRNPDNFIVWMRGKCDDLIERLVELRNNIKK